MAKVYTQTAKSRARRRLKETDTITYAARIGVRASDTQDLIKRVEQGFSYKSFERLLNLLELPTAELSDLLQIARRTLTRRKKAGKFPPSESERLLRLSKVLDSVVELFEGDREAAVEWLRSPNRALNGEIPLEMARTGIGAREVENLVGRLEYGVFS
jgi:putative toxin-antitoxin system antitoxin component (TIGR02293 family)